MLEIQKRFMYNDLCRRLKSSTTLMCATRHERIKLFLCGEKLHIAIEKDLPRSDMFM